MNRPADELSKRNFYEMHHGECVTCAYYRSRTTFRNGCENTLEWCENIHSDNYKQVLEDVYACDDWEGQTL